MSVIIKCEDGKIEIDPDSISTWSVKDLVQDDVLCLPFETNLIKLVLNIQLHYNFYSEVEYTLIDLYKAIHFIGESRLLQIMRDIALRRDHVDFLLEYLREWNIDEIKLLTIEDVNASDNKNLFIIFKYCFEKGFHFLKPLLEECAHKTIPNTYYPLLLFNQYNSRHTTGRRLHQIIRDDRSLNYCAAFEFFMNNELYMKRYSELIENEKSNIDVFDVRETFKSAKDGTIPLLIMKFFECIKAWEGEEQVVLVNKKSSLYRIRQIDTIMISDKIQWSRVFDFTTKISDKFSLGIENLIKVKLNEIGVN